MDNDETLSFKVERESNEKIKEIMKEVYASLKEKGYNPINQIVGYILSGDPTYISKEINKTNWERWIAWKYGKGIFEYRWIEYLE